MLPFMLVCPPGWAADASLREIAASKEWFALLFYSPRLTGAPSGIVDSKAFYLHPEGKTSPLSELEATLSRFREEEGVQKPELNDFARCQFPARYAYLKQKFPDLRHSHLECPWIRDYFTAVEPQGVSLVFSAFYLNNPSSMMGHTFIRFKRQARGGELRSSYLDYIVNFAANPTTSNPLLYALNGLTGQFPGSFSLQPYYLKIAEYVNQESRDLWEYELQLTPVEIEALLLSVLEVGQHRVDYFYIDENCSYIMLFLLDAARPSLDLRTPFYGIVAPTDTLRAVYASGLVGDISPIPSQRRRFQQRFADLGSQEKAVLRSMAGLEQKRFSDEAPLLLQGLSDQERVAVLDTFLDYVSFVEKLAGEKKPIRYEQAFAKTLELRAQLKLSSAPLVFQPRPEQQPHLAHGSQRFLLGLKRQESQERPSLQKNFALVGLRPSLHDLETFSGGFPPGVGIELGQTLLGWEIEDGRAEVLQFKLVDIRSLTPQSFSNTVPSWGLAVGYDSYPRVKEDALDQNGAYFLSGEVGLSTYLLSERQLLSFMLNPELQLRPWKKSSLSFNLHAGPDLLLYLDPSLSLSAYIQVGSSSEKKEKGRLRYGASTRFYSERDWEWGLKAHVEHAVTSIDTHLGFFW